MRRGNGGCKYRKKFFVQSMNPFIVMHEITVHSAYRYNTEEGYKLFVLYSYPCLGHTKGDISLKNSENTLVRNIKKPFLSQSVEGLSSREEVW